MPTSAAGLTETQLREGLRSCLSVQRWVDDVLARAPFSSMLELMDVAAAAANPLTRAEIDEALAAHPRIGERPTGDATEDALSRDEQQSSVSDDATLAQALADGNAAYEQKFGRVFLIRAAGRDRSTIVDELQRRLQLDHETELDLVATELRDIALMRIPKLFG